jgi:magnesium transporter
VATPAWTDLVDPSADAVREHLPHRVHEDAFVRLAAAHAAGVRPSIQGRGEYVFGVLLAPVAVPTEDRVYYQEVDFIVTADELLTIRKTPPDGEVMSVDDLRETCERHERISLGAVVYHLVDGIAERYLDLVDALDDEVDELEGEIESRPASEIQRRVSELRRDLLGVRRTLAPTRDAVRGIVDGRTDIEGRPLFRREVFPTDVERQFQGVYDKLLRASEALEFVRDLVASVRDYHQTRVAIDQNEVTKKLTVIAALLLFPTFIVGVYGQNFDHMPELGWRLGYLFSWGIVAALTVAQLVFFRRKRWI